MKLIAQPIGINIKFGLKMRVLVLVQEVQRKQLVNTKRSIATQQWTAFAQFALTGLYALQG